MPVEKRTYGQGAQGETAPEIRPVKLVARTRYFFDNLIARPGIFITIMFVGTFLLALALTILSYQNGDAPEQDQRWEDRPVFITRLWFVFSLIFMPAGTRLEGTNLDRFIAVTLWAGTTIFNAFILAFVTAKLIDFMNKLKRGKSAVIDSNHTLILGWSNRIFPLLKELNIASEGKKSAIAILADKERAAIEAEIEARAGELKNLRIISRTGDINSSKDLERVNAPHAKSIILLDSENGSDANVVSCVLAVKAAGAKHIPLIAEVDDAKIGKALKLATDNQVIPVRSDEIIARITAQASRQVGLAAVVLDLLDFDGSEIYFTNVPALVGKTYGEAVISFNDSSVIGIISATGVSQLNPARNYKIAAGDRIIVIAEDDTKVTYSGIQDAVLNRTSRTLKVAAAKPANLLVIGWSLMGEAVLNELSAFLPKGSTVTIATNKELVAADALKAKKWGNLKVTHKSVSGEVDELVALSKGQKFDEIIVLGYRKGLSAADADAHTMLTMLQLNQLKLTSKSGEDTRLIAEILDSRKASLARVAADGDLVISDNLGALLIAQLSENPALATVFEDLFSQGGASILISPIENYATLGKSVSFGEIAAAAADLGESAIGYRVTGDNSLDGSTGVTLNPLKTTSFVPKAGDSLVVIGKF